MRRAAVAASVLALSATLAACGGDDGSRAQRDAKACAGTSVGDAALHGAEPDVSQRVQDAENTAAEAAHALPKGDGKDPEDPQAQAVRALLSQSMRLRVVRTQIARGSPPAQDVLHAAAAGLTAGDRIARERLAAAGITC